VLLARAEKLIAIEVDTVLVHYLRQRFSDAIAEGRLTLVEGDILQTDVTTWGAAPVVGNLPYYITSPIVEKVLSARVPRAVFLVQAEVAARLAAGPGSRDYGYLSVLAQSQARVENLFPVPAAAFKPPPKVESAVVRMTPRDTTDDFGITDLRGFLRFAGICFRQKRKTLRNNLSTAYPKEIVDPLLESLALGKTRAEQMNVAELARLHRSLLERQVL
jgi:16S rRNA (adenine1518-N6/adenine1519-N6)-dimethyltransferase